MAVVPIHFGMLHFNSGGGILIPFKAVSLPAERGEGNGKTTQAKQIEKFNQPKDFRCALVCEAVICT